MNTGNQKINRTTPQTLEICSVYFCYAIVHTLCTPTAQSPSMSFPQGWSKMT